MNAHVTHVTHAAPVAGFVRGCEVLVNTCSSKYAPMYSSLRVSIRLSHGLKKHLDRQVKRSCCTSREAYIRKIIANDMRCSIITSAFE
jgi:hypothetical protein